jgi:hypothetical protein
MGSIAILSDEELAEKAVAAVRKDDEDAANVRAGPVVRNFMGGDLVFVIYDDGEEEDAGDEIDEDEDEDDDEESESEDDSDDEYEPEEQECYVHFNEERTHIYWFSLDLARAVASYKPTLWHHLLNAGVIPGSIAIVITLTICGLAVGGRANSIPEVLAAALTTILGFYFGSQVARR